mmetsp:Transcript_29462/g.70156  ORF Transcript_29462/g.70156 Transcript_29462/m.70156 type:complete len:155 (+) Transcript_29462:485-949(+)
MRTCLHSLLLRVRFASLSNFFSYRKRIGAGKWDLSCAEHLQPGESYREGAQRGLQEELDIRKTISAGPLSPTHLREHKEGFCFVDREFVESYRVDNYVGSFRCDPEEVEEAKFISLIELKQAVEQHPEEYTPWFLDEIRLLDWFGAVEAVDDQQ